MTSRVQEDLPIMANLPDGLQQQIVAVWESFLERSEWPSPAQAPNDRRHPGISLADHHEQVARSALAAASVLRNGLGVELADEDLVAGGILIDVDKLERFPKSGSVQSSTSSYEHGKSGAQVAKDFGLNETVLDIVSNHSPGSKELPETAEGILISYIDFLLHDMLQAGRRGPFIVRVMKPDSVVLALGR